MFGCHCGRPPAIPSGGIPGPLGPKLLLGGGPRIPGPYEPGPIGPMLGPRGGFIRGFICPIPGGPPSLMAHTIHIRYIKTGGQWRFLFLVVVAKVVIWEVVGFFFFKLFTK